jgi:DNA-binding transcriptional LysR family regulator
MNLAQIEAFVAVAETGSIGNAAHRLGLTQPAVTRQIQSLEQTLGTTLLDRRSKPPTLTPSGRIALEHCRHLLKVLTELKESVNEIAEPSGNFRLGVAFGATDLVLSEPIDLLRKGYPELKIEVIADWTGNLIRQTEAGAIDAAIILRPHDKAPPPELHGRALGQDEIVVVASKRERLSPNAEISSLDGYTWVMNPKGCWYRDLLQQILSRASISLQIAIETFGLEYQLSLISRGVGLGFVPRWAVERSAYRKELKMISLAECKLQLTVWSIQAGYMGRLRAALHTLEDAISKNIR